MTTNEFLDFLIFSCENIGITLTYEQALQFAIYKDMLLDWNTRINLTAITDEKEIAIKHFSDSLALLHYFSLSNGASVLDVGSGAGFPGIPLKLVQPEINLTLLDSLNKRIIFINQLLSALSTSAAAIHERAEIAGHIPELRESFELVTARAVSFLPSLCEYCLPFVRIGGHFVALKGPNIDEEIEQSISAIKILGGEIVKTCSYTLSDKSGRSLVIIKKISKTPDQYPRNSAKITKKPL